MKYLYVPNTLKAAGQQVRMALATSPETLPTASFVRAWCSVAYLFPGLHPDGFDDAGSGWPRALRRFAAEAWRRLVAGEIGEAEFYPSDAQWAGLYDRMLVHLPDEAERRSALAASFGLTAVN
jgi:hypothetical protein